MTSLFKVAVLTLPLLFAAHAGAAERGTEAEAQAMVGKAVALIKSAGPEKAYKAFTEHPDGTFKDRDLYIFVYDFEGNCIAQGANPKMVGKNLIAMKDVDGNAFIKGMIDTVKTKKKGWYGPYKFNNAESKLIEQKKSYCEQGAGDTMVCVGTYLAAK
ncbi:cache domain-containing protein [Actimicrobium antarcticum]|uniref:Single Cache domain-containing protein n=1 Tax=Actimicrobium antarcticum TaxID=1051899 RepID=A0ABP7TYZ2_9BURK